MRGACKEHQTRRRLVARGEFPPMPAASTDLAFLACHAQALLLTLPFCLPSLPAGLDCDVSCPASVDTLPALLLTLPFC